MICDECTAALTSEYNLLMSPENPGSAPAPARQPALLRSALCCLLLACSAGIAAEADAPAEQTANAPPAVKPGTVRIGEVRGRVVISFGTSYQAARPNQVIPTGVKVITGEDSGITIIYTDGCVRNLQANSMLTVPLQSGCAVPVAPQRQYVETPSGVSPAGAAASSSSFFSTASMTLLGAAIAGAALSGGGGSRENISPE